MGEGLGVALPLPHAGEGLLTGDGGSRQQVHTLLGKTGLTEAT